MGLPHILKTVTTMTKSITDHELDFLNAAHKRDAIAGADYLVVCARRMARTLNSKPSRGKTRAYIATLPKRKQVKVQPEEFVRARAIVVRQVARLAASVVSVPPRKDRVRPRAVITPTIRDLLYEAQDGCCGGCGFELGYDRTIDHVIPRCEYGANEMRNYLLMHASCNNAKGARMPNLFERDANRRKNECLAQGTSASG
jgi:5-methylcytosine-specific restriction endonuclease McrA